MWELLSGSLHAESTRSARPHHMGASLIQERSCLRSQKQMMYQTPNGMYSALGKPSPLHGLQEPLGNKCQRWSKRLHPSPASYLHQMVPALQASTGLLLGCDVNRHASL